MALTPPENRNVKRAVLALIVLGFCCGLTILFLSQLRLSRDDDPLIVQLAQRDDLAGVKTLLDRGVRADQTSSDGYGQTALWYAVRRQDIKLARLLLDHGADINFNDIFGRTPLDEARMRKLDSMIPFLRASGGKTGCELGTYQKKGWNCTNSSGCDSCNVPYSETDRL